MPPAARDAPIPRGTLKIACQGSLCSLATSSQLRKGVRLPGGGMALLSHPRDAAAPDHLCRQEHGFLQHFSFLSQGCSWPAAQPRCPHPSIRQHTKRKGAPFCFSAASLTFLSDAGPISPSLHLLRAQHRADGEGGPVVTDQANRRPERSLSWGLAAGSTQGPFPPCSSTSPSCHRPVPFPEDSTEPCPSLARSAQSYATSSRGTHDVARSSSGSHPALLRPPLGHLAWAPSTASPTNRGTRTRCR